MRPLKKLNPHTIDDDSIQEASNRRINKRQERNSRMVENVLLIWLDEHIDNSDIDCQNTIKQLQHTVNSIQTFINSDECLQFLKTIEHEKACMIISGSLGQYIVPQIHNMFQVDSIFIFCGNKELHQQWVKEWSKIKGIFTDIGAICEDLKVAAQQCEQNATPISFMATNDDISKKKLNQLEPSFMYSQILKEILLTINFNEQHMMDFFQYCHDIYQDNQKELNNVKELKHHYHEKTPIWWYTYESFLYPMLNRALRVLDGDIIIKLGFFIRDLHCQIEELHKEQFSDSKSGATLTVYRGQGLTQTEFQKMKDVKGGLLSFNCFLSTSTNRQISLRFVNHAVANPDLVGILFVMDVDHHQSITPFASVADVGRFRNREEEILFSMHTVFRIIEITSTAENSRIYQVNLTLTSDNDPDLCVLTDHIREEAAGLAGWDQLGQLLIQMGQPAKAQEVYEILLEQSTNQFEKVLFHYQLGTAKNHPGEYKEAVTFFNNALETQQQSLPPNHPDLGRTYLSIGNVYIYTGEYSKALSSYEKSLEIKQQSLPFNHPDLATTYMNIGTVYFNMDDYSKALSSFEKAFEIQQQSLPHNHPQLATNYMNMGNVHAKMGEYSKALSSYQKTLEIQQQSLPSNHPDLALTYINIGEDYRNMGEYSKALSSFEKAFEIQQQSLPPNHPDLGRTYTSIGNVYTNIGEYSKALSSYEKALAIQQQSLPLNHPEPALTYMNIGNVYADMYEYSKALSSYQKTLEIQQQSLPPNHSHLAGTYMSIGNMYANMDEYSKALLSLEKALEIQQQSLPPNHPDLGRTYMNIGNVYADMYEYSKVLSSYEKALTIQQQSLPFNHPDLATTYMNIGTVYVNMDEYSKALSSFEKALEIQQQSASPNHLHLAMTYRNIGQVYTNMGDYSKALSSLEKLLEMQQQSLPPNHLDMAASYDNLAFLYKDIGDFSKAFSFAELAVKIAEQSLPTNHPNLQKWRRHLENIETEFVINTSLE